MRRSRRYVGFGFLLAIVAAARYLQQQRAKSTDPAPTPWPSVPSAIDDATPDPTVNPVEDTDPVEDVEVDKGTSWVEPCDGSCPETHPIKVKLRSKLFHRPGMAAYQRTNADRCYRSAEDAIEDGFRASSR
jgi:hypothetical protein